MEFCSDQVYIAVSYYLRVITQHTRLQGARINGFLSMGSSFLVCDLPHRLLTHTHRSSFIPFFRSSSFKYHTSYF